VTGHVAESVVEVLLAVLGYHVLWHFTGPGRHGVDLAVLCPRGERVVVVEAKGSLRAGHWPRLSHRGLAQLSARWLDKLDNPGMANWKLCNEDVYGAVMLVNFAAMAYRAAMTPRLRSPAPGGGARAAYRPRVARQPTPACWPEDTILRRSPVSVSRARR
jgi:hypothetical protein